MASDGLSLAQRVHLSYTLKKVAEPEPSWRGDNLAADAYNRAFGAVLGAVGLMECHLAAGHPFFEACFGYYVTEGIGDLITGEHFSVTRHIRRFLGREDPA